MDHTGIWSSCFLCVAVLTISVASGAEPELVTLPFDAEHWQLARARALEVDGRSAVVGTAFATGIELGNGILEVDIKVPSKEMRSYPGFIFRMKSPADAERVYLRPHRAPLYDDAVQYSAVFNGIAGWQLYAGEGATASTTIPIGEWFTLRLEISGDRARVLLDGQPVLDVANLRHGARSGGVGLIGPADGSAVFSDFRWAAADDLDLGPTAPVLNPPGVLSKWQLSNAIAFADIDPNRLPDLGAIEWTDVKSEPSGLVDIARYVAPAVPGPPTVIARTTLHAGEARTMALQLGYSDRVTVFLDGTPVFRAVSDYRSRDSGFLGVVGAFDTLYLPLSKGDHELALQVTETFGGWGFMCRDGDAVKRAPGIEEQWRVDGLTVPESVLYDPRRKVVYVSNFDAFRMGGEGAQHLSRVSGDGALLNEVWVGGLTNPTGLAWRGDELLVVERRSVAVIDPATVKVTKRIPIPEGRLLNDIAVAADGTVFVSDSRAGLIYRIGTDDQPEKWLQLDAGLNPNGVCVDGGRLFVGLNPVHRLIAVDLEDRSIDDHALLPTGLVDGIEALGDGSVAVSQAEGRLLRVTADGGVDPLIDASNLDHPFADFDIADDAGLLIVPTYYTGQVAAYSLPSK